MRFTPVSEEQASGCFPKGEYDAEVINAIEKVSKSNNPMIELDLKVWGPEGREQTVRDWLVGTDGGQGKIQGFCKSADMWDTYQAGELSAEACKGRQVVVRLGIQEPDGDFPPRNKVLGYKPFKAPGPQPDKPAMQGVDPMQRASAGTGRADPKAPPTSDDIPF